MSEHMLNQSLKIMSSKAQSGRYFEDFHPGLVMDHAIPRTLNSGDVALTIALYGSRHALFASEVFAKTCRAERQIIDPLLVFHTVFGKSVPDISQNAVANLGYAEGRFLKPVLVGDSLSAKSTVLGVRESQKGEAGIVYVRTLGHNQYGEEVLSYIRWVLVKRRQKRLPALGAPSPETTVVMKPCLAVEDLVPPETVWFHNYDFAAAGAPFCLEDYQVGERMDHKEGVTLEEAEAQLATRLYQNTAGVHFNQYERTKDPSGRRLIYGGVVMSLARALSFNGLQNAGLWLGLNSGRHVNPCFAGSTIFAWSEVLDVKPLPHRADMGALRLRLVATKDRPCTDFPDKDEAGVYPAHVILDLDYWVAIPKAL